MDFPRTQSETDDTLTHAPYSNQATTIRFHGTRSLTSHS